MFSALAEGHGDLKNKINLFVALCPITNLAHASADFMRWGRNYYEKLASTLNYGNIYQIEGPNMQFAKQIICLAIPCDYIEKWSLPTATHYNDA